MKLLNWGFRNTNTFEISKKNQTIFELDTWLGIKNKVKATTKQDFFVTINKKDIRHLSISLDYTGPIKAPINKNTEIAKIIVKKKDATLKEIPLYEIETVKVNFLKVYSLSKLFDLGDV